MTRGLASDLGWPVRALSSADVQLLFEHAPCGYHSLDAHGVYREINRTELEWLGRRSDEVVGKLRFADVMTAASRQTFEQKFPVFKEHGRIDGVLHEVVSPDGRVTTVTLTAVAIYNEAGEYVASRALLFDITPLARAEQEQRELNARLQAALREQRVLNEELEAFSYSVSHDLRAPLRALDGLSQALLEEYADRLDDRGRDYASRVRSGAQRMAALIDDLLELSRVSQANVTREPIDMSRLVQDVVAELAAGDPDRRVTVSVQNGLRAEGDPTLLRVVLQNLVGNAWKFTRHTEHARIDIRRDDASAVPGFLVRDNGAGFDMRHAGKLFGVFQRLHSAAEFPGTGVGLATVQRVVHKHGGRIWAEGEVGGGATFRFTLQPASVEAASAC